MTYGLYVLGVEHQGDLRAASITWVSQASFEPSLMVMGIKKTGRPFSLLKESRKFALSIPESGQKDMAFAFFKTGEGKNGKMGDFAYETATTGAPIISAAMAWLEGEVQSIDETGDHAVVIGRITNAGVKRDGKALTLEELGLKYGG